MSRPRCGYHATPIVLAYLAILAFAPFWQQRWGSIPDTSWLITVCERVLGGERLYVDIIEVNPPFSVMIYLPAVMLAQAFGLAPEIAVEAYSYAIVLLGLSFATWIARQADFAENKVLFGLLPALLALFVIFPGNAFTEREHYGVVLLLPFLALTAWRAEPEARKRPGTGVAALAGVFASVIALVKPHYAIAIAVPAFYLALRNRSLRPLFVTEYLVIAAVCFGYLTVVLVYYPQFFSAMFPLLTDTYMRAKSYSDTATIFLPVYGVFLGLLWMVRRQAALSAPTVVCLLASLSLLAPLLYQGKGWPYHAYPALALIIITLICRIAQLQSSTRAPGLPIGYPVLFAVCVMVSWFPFSQTERPSGEFVAAISREVRNPTVAVVSSDFSAGHPLTRMLGGRFASAYPGDWLGACALYLSIKAREAGALAEAERYDRIAADYAAFKYREFSNIRPDLIVVNEKADIVWRQLLMDNFGFARLMSGYRFLAGDGKLVVYIRSDYRHPVAAAG